MLSHRLRCLPEWAPDAALDALVLLVAGACLFWGLGGPPIRDNNEALYADIAWAMARGGSWIIPHLDGVPYIEKPPLLYWLMALSFKAFGAGTWQARLPDALAAWLISAGCIAYGRHLGTRVAGRFAALVSGTALGLVLIARTILFDPLMLLLWLSALALTVLGVHQRRRGWLRVAAVPLALATLTKGPEALLLLGLIAVLQLLWAPGAWTRAALLRFYLDPWAIALFVLLVAPWHLAALHEQPGFAWFYFINETIMRFLGRRIPDDYHAGPWWYYGPRLLIGFFQWSALLALLAWRSPPLQGNSGADLALDSARWARNAAVVLTVFFSMAGNKGAYYLLPVVPLVAWWLGIKLQLAADQGVLPRLLPWLGGGAALFGVFAAVLGGVSLMPAVQAYWRQIGLPQAQFALLPALIGGVALLGLLAGALLACRRLQAGLLALGLSGVVMVGFATELDIAKTADTSQKQVAATLHAALPGGAAMFSWQTFEDHDASLLLYGWRPLRVIDSTSADLWFGCRHAPQASICVGPQALVQARAQGQAVAVWVARSRLPSFLRSGLAFGLMRLNFRDSVVFYSPGQTHSAAPRPENPTSLP
ncbi:MAG: glycosyltransferase family 39 protein [Betaproteobacteria bacterium]|nr:glycosyltransferase family 39 protein [Betaproteobacteria bacterium]MDE2123166.1 glycosyltransferase family 39 protein [Betaproteobacteria bacterium]MDE2187262.1 glycosyltransferase family 39 protein [Betaproteobacteria bacterium]MDE2323585.1 glycosyltransferase family 39 protein [Betaproteobacteria bacterium]